MLKNASPIEMKYSVGDIVCLSIRITTQVERPDGVLHHEFGPANDSEALARDFLKGEKTISSEIIGEGPTFC